MVFGRCDGHHEMVDLRRGKKRSSGGCHQAPYHGLGNQIATLRRSRGDCPPARLASC